MKFGFRLNWWRELKKTKKFRVNMYTWFFLMILPVSRVLFVLVFDLFFPFLIKDVFQCLNLLEIDTGLCLFGF